MINLVKAEATRWRSRRMLWVFAVVTLIAFAGLSTMVFFLSKPPSPAQIAEADQFYQQQHDEWVKESPEINADCPQVEPGELDECGWPEPRRADFVFTQPVKDLVVIVVQGGGAILALVVFILSASYIGAEMSSGAIANWLTFTPSRWKVMLSKLFVALLGSAVFAAAFMALGLVATAVIEGINGSGDDGVKWAPVLQQGGRVVALAVIAAAIGFGIALVARHTAAALGALGGFFVFRIITSAFSQSPKFASVPPWLPDNNALAFLSHDLTYYVSQVTTTPDGVQFDSVERILSFEHGLIYLLVCFVVAVSVSFLVFQRRDVE